MPSELDVTPLGASCLLTTTLSRRGDRRDGSFEAARLATGRPFLGAL